MADYYNDENVSKTEEHISPSGKYKLIIKTYNTSNISNKSTWEYTQGFVYCIDGNLIGSIKRNYMQFPFAFFKSNTSEYLVSGRSYMRQTILDCGTGQIYDNTDDLDADDFCWAEIIQLDANTIVAQGCYWGGGYEYKFFDFTDLFKGWPELKVDEIVMKKYYIDCSGETEHTVDGGVITINHLSVDDDDYDENKDYDNIKPETNIIVKLQRQFDTIKMIDLTLSEYQKIKEHDDDIRREKEEKETTELRNSNAFYQHLIPEINNLDLRVRDHVYLHSNTFSISVYYKKSKACIIEFKNDSIVKFTFYDWTNKENNLVLEFDQDITMIDDIINKIKALLM